MNYTLNKYKKEITEEVNRILGSDLIVAGDIAYPPNPEMGDLSLPMFKLAKELKKNPIEVAEDLMRNIKKDYIACIKIVGPYLNFVLNNKKLAQSILIEVQNQKDEYGTNDSGENKKVMIEYSNVNTHKQFHVGHLRNICYGDAIYRILKANGYISVPVSYVNDFGIHVAKTLWAFLEFYKNEPLPENKGKFLGDVYVRSVQESEDNKFAKQMIEIIMKKIESRKGEEYELWKSTRKWSIQQFENIHKELGVKFERKYYESEYIERGREIVAELIKRGILVKSDGAIIANLEDYDLGVLIFLRSDGTATYPVADLGLAMEKIKEFKLDQSIYVVDVRQSLHFKQLFKVFELAGMKADFKHLKHDFVKLPSGMMSSRSGNTVTYEDLIEQMMVYTKNETKERHEDWNEEKITDVAKKISIGAIKFEMLKVGVNQEITFDIKNALSFNGFTSAYLQYTYARINSIINKSKVVRPRRISQKTMKDCWLKNLEDNKEHQLILKIAKYPEIVIMAGVKSDTSEVAKYLFELAKDFNDYYHATKIIQEDKDLEGARIALIASINQIIKNGLDLLGIGIVNEM